MCRDRHRDREPEQDLQAADKKIRHRDIGIKAGDTEANPAKSSML